MPDHISGEFVKANPGHRVWCVEKLVDGPSIQEYTLTGEIDQAFNVPGRGYLSNWVLVEEPETACPLTTLYASRDDAIYVVRSRLQKEVDEANAALLEKEKTLQDFMKKFPLYSTRVETPRSPSKPRPERKKGT